MATFTPDNLIAGDFPIITEPVTVGAGNLVRGTVMGRITASGNFIQSLSAASDGSQNPVAILAEDVDASGGAKPGVVYLTGEFKGAALIIGASHTLASVKLAFRALGIFIRTTLAA
jgi:hypothetical protein